ncbi:hypothetical protein PML78_12405 [Enterococcus dispar]|uniref:hypothetical protein n=1 Tax=Enterococcus dispar TaxID=44009 RepID=UPI00232FAE29|nr:hypothetical protein [Enterococcus dispar]WCG32975.1 hypothetical protein PML78_12405 [Enterococcus dispar]
MNKQKLLDELAKLASCLEDFKGITGYCDGKYAAYEIAIELAKQLDEPQDEKVEAHLAEHWNEDIGDVLWWNFPVEEPPYCGTPLDEHFPKYKTHFTTIDMPNEIEKPKRWVVRQGGSEVWYLQGFRNSLDGDIVKQWCSYEGCIKFTDKSKAEAVAMLVEGSVEEV